MSELVKLTINLTPEAAQAVRKLATMQRTTVTNIVNRAIALEKFCSEERAKGNTLQIEDRKGNVSEVIFR